MYKTAWLSVLFLHMHQRVKRVNSIQSGVTREFFRFKLKLQIAVLVMRCHFNSSQPKPQLNPGLFFFCYLIEIRICTHLLTREQD